METTTAEDTGTTEAPDTGGKPKPTKKARVAPQRAHVAPKKAKASKKASPAKKAPKGQKKAPKAKKTAVARDGSKTPKGLDLLKRPYAVTLNQLLTPTASPPHPSPQPLSRTPPNNP